MKHRKNRLTAGQKFTRIGAMATIGLAAAATAVPAQAQGTHSGPAHDVGVAVDDVHTVANRVHTQRFEDSFTVHQFGPLIDATVHNTAVATSVACDPAAPCRSVALSFQIDTMSGTQIKLHAVNHSYADNEHCAGCQTFAGAWQFVVSTPRPFSLSASDERQLAAIHRQLDALRSSDIPVSEVQSQAEALAAKVTAILKAAAARAPKGPGTSALDDFQPTVTVHRQTSV
jgi:hypothetical protein